MATFRKRGSRWRVELCRDGKRESATFATKAEAAGWAMQREAELGGERLPNKTVGDAFRRYATDVSPRKRGARWEMVRLAALCRDPLAAVLLPKLTPSHLAQWRDRRLCAVSGASVRREFNLIQSVLGIARKEWGWLRDDPARDVRRPQDKASRKRRITPDEVARVVMALGYASGKPSTVSHRVALAFLFALETAMRSGEILGLRWGDVDERFVTLPRTKNGDVRQVPLSVRAREILDSLPASFGPVFGLNQGQRDALWRKAVKRAGVEDLHFHDSRAEAIFRLSKKLDVMELARVIGHRDLRSLLLYYAADAAELAAKLG